MGAWPEFYTCCWVVPLKSATVIIAVCSLILNAARMAGYVSAIALHLTDKKQEDQNNAKETLYDIIVFTWYIVISMCEAVAGAIILLSINKAYLLRKTVSFLTVIWLLSLLISLVNASREAYLDAYINVVSMLLSAYFILIIRSYHLKIEGRLGSIDSLSRQISISDSFMSSSNPMFRQPPPNYDEAMRQFESSNPPDYFSINEEVYMERQSNNGNTGNENIVPNQTSVNISTQDDNNNEINTDEPEQTAVLPIEEQRTVHSRRLSRQASLTHDSISNAETTINSRRHSTQVTVSNSRNNTTEETSNFRRKSIFVRAFSLSRSSKSTDNVKEFNSVNTIIRNENINDSTT